MRIVDIHSHILPGVDDGSKSMDETLRMLRIAQSEGITDMIATPHYQSKRFFTPAEKVREMTEELQVEAAAQGIFITLYPGTEIYYRSGLEAHLNKGELATLNGGSHVLVEFSPFEEFSYIRNAMEDFRGMGYRPVLAHVERFACLLENIGRVRELRGMGCRIQANAGSISGDYGFRVKRYLHGLLREELIDYVGTDAHNAAGRAPRMKKCRELLQKKYHADYVERLLWKNALEFLTGEWE